MINQKPNAKALILDDKNNHKYIHQQVAKGGGIHIFTSLEIALSKKFKKNILDDLDFTNRLCLLAIDEIYFVDQWGQAF